MRSDHFTRDCICLFILLLIATSSMLMCCCLLFTTVGRIGLIDIVKPINLTLIGATSSSVSLLIFRFSLGQFTGLIG
jgi:hypothetical protein